MLGSFGIRAYLTFIESFLARAFRTQSPSVKAATLFGQAWEVGGK